MDVSVIIALSSAAFGVTARSLFIFLDRRGDRKLARHVFNQTRSTDALDGYARLRKAQRPLQPPPERSAVVHPEEPGAEQAVLAAMRHRPDHSTCSRRGRDPAVCEADLDHFLTLPAAPWGQNPMTSQ